jgi:hypothetical protein
MADGMLWRFSLGEGYVEWNGQPIPISKIVILNGGKWMLAGRSAIYDSLDKAIEAAEVEARKHIAYLNILGQTRL